MGRTVKGLKGRGFAGVILGYAREVVVEHEKAKSASEEVGKDKAEEEAEIEGWKRGTLETVEMTEKGDFVALKYASARTSSMNASVVGYRSDTDAPTQTGSQALEVTHYAFSRRNCLWMPHLRKQQLRYVILLQREESVSSLTLNSKPCKAASMRGRLTSRNATTVQRLAGP